MTYMNSSADIKGFVGRNGGVVCTSSNAKRALDWAFERGQQVLFLPDQHLGRNTAVLEMGLDARRLRALRPAQAGRRPDRRAAARREDDPVARALLGARPVHARLRRRGARSGCPASTCWSTPSAGTRWSRAADYVGSTEYIIRTIEAAPAGSAWAVGTELNLVRRLATAHPDKQIMFLDRTVCYCSTMNRIDLPHLVWALEELVAGRVVNQITVDPRHRAPRPGRARPDARAAVAARPVNRHGHVADHALYATLHAVVP